MQKRLKGDCPVASDHQKNNTLPVAGLFCKDGRHFAVYCAQEKICRNFRLKFNQAHGLQPVG
jgi:hypothetical protein